MILPSMTLWKTSIRYVFRSYVYLSLSVIGIAIGVAVVVAVDLSSATASKQLQASTRAIMGSSSHHVVSGPQGVAEALYARIRREGIPYLKAAPIVEGIAKIENSQYVITLLGIDPFAEMSFRTFLPIAGVDDRETLLAFLTEPNTAIVAENFIGLAVPPVIGDQVSLNVAGRVTQLRVVGLISHNLLGDQAGLDSIVFTDLSTAQELLSSVGYLTRVDVRFEGGQLNENIEAIAKILPEAVLVVPSRLRKDALTDVTKAFDLNLTALSFLSLMVGVFLIYNTMSFSVVRRRTTIGLLRAIGVTRFQILLLFFGEAFVFAIVSSLLGLLIGIGLAQVLLDITLRTLSDIFITSNAYQLDLAPLILLKGVAVGFFTTTIAAILPAYEATTGSSLRAIRISSVETAFRKNLGKMSALGGGAFIGGVSLLGLPYQSVFISLIALALVTGGMSLQIPASMAMLSKGALVILRGRVPVVLVAAIRSIEASLSRTAIAVCALSLAVAVTVGIGLMTGSFRTTVEHWLDTSLDADIYISPPPINSHTLNGVLNPELVNVIERQPEILETTKLYTTQLETQAGPIQLSVVNASEQVLANSADLKQAVTSVWGKFKSTPAVIISEAYALHNGVLVGDTLSLPTIEGPLTFSIIGVYHDYSSTRGVVMMHHAIYDLYWGGRKTSSIAVYLETGVNIDDFIQTLYEVSQPYQLLQIRDSQNLYATSLNIFDRTFQVTSVLRTITIIVACIGVLSALVAHQIERAREGMIFRAIGLTPGQHRALVGIQGVILGVYSGFFAMPLGIVISWFLVKIINRRSFGWEMDLQLQWLVVGEGFLIAVGAAAVAGLYPALRRQGSRSTAEMSRAL